MGENFDNVGEIGIGGVDQSEDGITENVFQPRSPGDVAIKLFENGDDARGDQFFLRIILGFQNIEGIDVFGISGVKVATIIDAGGGDIVEDGRTKVAVGVDDGHPAAFADVVDGHVGDKSGFSGTGFTNNIGVTTAVFAGLDTKNSIVVVELGTSKEGDILTLVFGEAVGDRKIFGRIGKKVLTPGDVGNFNHPSGEMPESGELLNIKNLLSQAHIDGARMDGFFELFSSKKAGSRGADEVTPRAGVSTKRGGSGGNETGIVAHQINLSKNAGVLDFLFKNLLVGVGLAEIFGGIN